MDYHHRTRGRQKRSILPRLVLVGSIVLLLSAVGFSVYEYKIHPEWLENVVAYKERVGFWLSERKQGIRPGIAKVGGDADEQDHAVRPVNFEFYSTLQDMTSMQAEARAEAQLMLAEKEAAESKRVAAKPAPVKKVASNFRGSASPDTKNRKQIKVNHAADLEKDLLATIKKTGGGK